MLPAVDLGGRVWLGSKSCKGGPATPPSATDGLERTCHPAIVCHQELDAKERLKRTQGPCQFFRCVIFTRVLTAVHSSFAYNILRSNQSDTIAQDRYAAALGSLKSLLAMRFL